MLSSHECARHWTSVPDAWWSRLAAHINRNSHKVLNLESSLFFIFWSCSKGERKPPGVYLRRSTLLFPHQARQKAAAAAGLRMFRRIGSGLFFRRRRSFVLLTEWCRDSSVKSWKSKNPHLRLQKLTVFLHHVIYRQILCFWGQERRENSTLLREGGIGW